LKLKCDGPLSNFAFNSKLRRYNEDDGDDGGALDAAEAHYRAAAAATPW
jgi:hypothetical protein